MACLTSAVAAQDYLVATAWTYAIWRGCLFLMSWDYCFDHANVILFRLCCYLKPDKVFRIVEWSPLVNIFIMVTSS